MRKKVSGLVTVRAISGTHVVFLAFNMRESDAKGLMGFAIQRTDFTEDETIWLRGNKTFASIRPSTGALATDARKRARLKREHSAFCHAIVRYGA